MLVRPTRLPRRLFRMLAMYSILLIFHNLWQVPRPAGEAQIFTMPVNTIFVKTLGVIGIVVEAEKYFDILLPIL